jgi:hypothetical protein
MPDRVWSSSPPCRRFERMPLRGNPPRGRGACCKREQIEERVIGNYVSQNQFLSRRRNR